MRWHWATVMEYETAEEEDVMGRWNEMDDYQLFELSQFLGT